MADVNERSVPDRAQMILVSGLVIAVTLLVLVLLLNSVIYSENVATRGVGDEPQHAANLESSLEQEFTRLLEMSASDHDIEEHQLHQQAWHAAVALLEFHEETQRERGYFLRHEAIVTSTAINAESPSGPEASEILYVESFTLTLDDYATALSDGQELVVEAGDEEWELVIWLDEDGRLNVQAQNDEEQICDGEWSSPEIDFLTGEVEDTECFDGWDDTDGAPPGVEAVFAVETPVDEPDAIQEWEMVTVGTAVEYHEGVDSVELNAVKSSLLLRGASLRYETVIEQSREGS